MLHRICTTDPITLNDIPDPDGKPYLVIGEKDNDLVVYFESELNRQAYLDIPVEHPACEHRLNLDNPTEIFIDEG